MLNKKLDYKKALNLLKDKSNLLVYWIPFNGEIRTSDGKSIGNVSVRIMDKLLNSDLLIDINNKTGILANEKYYKLKV